MSKEIFYMHIDYKGKRYNVGISKKQLAKAFKTQTSFEQLLEMIVNKIIQQ